MVVSRSKLILSILAIVAAITSSAHAQNRVDLEDLNIKGELLNDNRMRLSARDAHRISDRVSYRDNFRKEISDGLEIPWPDLPNETTASSGGTP